MMIQKIRPAKPSKLYQFLSRLKMGSKRSATLTAPNQLEKPQNGQKIEDLAQDEYSRAAQLPKNRAPRKFVEPHRF